MIENPKAGDKGFTRDGQKVKIMRVHGKTHGQYPLEVIILNTMGSWVTWWLTIDGYEYDSNRESPHDMVRKADWL